MALQVRLPEELHAEIRELTEREDRPLNRTIIRLLRAGLDHYRTSQDDDPTPTTTTTPAPPAARQFPTSDDPAD